MKKYLFVGEQRSELTKKMNVTWKDKHLAAAPLYRALKEIGICWNDCAFLNVFEDDICDIKSFNGIVIAMGRTVEKELKKHQISHLFIYHPATRGSVRKTENYNNHVRERIGHIV